MTNRRGGRQDTEHEALVRSILRLLNLVPGCFAWRNDTGMMPRRGGKGFRPYGTPGAPDVFVVYRGKLHGIEVKTGTGRLTDVQQHFHGRLVSAGAVVGIARSLEDAERIVGVRMIAGPTRPADPR